VALLGALLVISATRAALILFALLVLVAVRPVAARLGLRNAAAGIDRHAVAWFGIRGVASVYCLMFAIDQNLSPAFANKLAAITLTVLAISIALHGLTALPLGNHPAGARS
ncbi:MAG: cation:proton antiporter, partial [Steroidobacteraceae bacterium]